MHAGPGDLVQCYVCGVQLTDWREGQNPRQRHVESVDACSLKHQLAMGRFDDVDAPTDDHPMQMPRHQEGGYVKISVHDKKCAVIYLNYSTF